jgi:hypothetical protein
VGRRFVQAWRERQERDSKRKLGWITDLLLVQRLVNDPVVSFSVFEKSSHVPLEGFWFDFVEMPRQPRDLFDDSLGGGGKDQRLAESSRKPDDVESAT